MPALIVIAKAPVAGRVKTRLSPPCAPEEAAALAEAALADTLAAVARSSAHRRVLALEGFPGPWLPQGLEVIAQRGAGLADRLAAAFCDTADAALLIGMDTPQVTPELLEQGLIALEGHDAVIGDAADGGFWAVGLRRPRADAFLGLPMSTAHTSAALRARLLALGLRVAELPVLRDVDVFGDAVAVARLQPQGRFAAMVASVVRRHSDLA